MKKSPILLLMSLAVFSCAAPASTDKPPLTPQQKCEQQLINETFTRADARVLANQIELIKFHCNIKHNSDK